MVHSVKRGVSVIGWQGKKGRGLCDWQGMKGGASSLFPAREAESAWRMLWTLLNTVRILFF